MTLRLCIEPNPDHYDIPAGEMAELGGLDAEEDVLDIVVHNDACLSIYSFNDIAVFVSDHRLLTVSDT